MYQPFSRVVEATCKLFHSLPPGYPPQSTMIFSKPTNKNINASKLTRKSSTVLFLLCFCKLSILRVQFSRFHFAVDEVRILQHGYFPLTALLIAPTRIRVNLTNFIDMICPADIFCCFQCCHTSMLRHLLQGRIFPNARISSRKVFVIFLTHPRFRLSYDDAIISRLF